MTDSHAAKLRQTQQDRERAFAQLGELHPELVTSVMPSFVAGRPPWPSTMTPSLRLVQLKKFYALMTNGLSDPFDPNQHGDDGELGCGVELFAYTHESLSGINEVGLEKGLQPLSRMLLSVGDWEAHEQGLRPLVERFNAVTVEIEAPTDWTGEALDNGNIAVLLAAFQKGSTFPMFLKYTHGDVLFLGTKVLTPDEYAFAVEGGNSGGLELARRFWARGDALMTWPGRPSVLREPEFKD